MITFPADDQACCFHLKSQDSLLCYNIPSYDILYRPVCRGDKSILTSQIIIVLRPEVARTC